MGCGGSKADDSQLVRLCRERKELIKASSDHRYALAAAHVAYFASLKDVGDALRKFVDEEIVIGGSFSSMGSPVLTLPSDEGKPKKKKHGEGEKGKNSSSSTSISHSVDNSNSPPAGEDDGHLHLSSGSDSDSDSGSSGHIHKGDDGHEEDHHHHHHKERSSSYRYPPQGQWDPPGPSSSSYGGYPPEGPLVPPGMSSYGYYPPGPWGSQGGNSDRYPQGSDGMYPPGVFANNYPQPQGYWDPNTSSGGYPPEWGNPVVDSQNYPQGNWGDPRVNTHTYYMKKSAAPSKSYVYKQPDRHRASNGQWPEPERHRASNGQWPEPERHRASNGQWHEPERHRASNGQWPEPERRRVVNGPLPDAGYGYPGSSQPGNQGFFGFSMGMQPNDSQYTQQQPSPPPPAPAPPSPPAVSTWDFLNVFETYDYGQSGFLPQPKFGYGSSTSSPDSKEVREREGIPDLEDETEQEMLKAAHKERRKLSEVHKEKKKMEGDMERNKFAGEGTSRGVPSQTSEDSSTSVSLHNRDNLHSGHHAQGSSSETIVSKSSENEYVKKKGVTFEIDEVPMHVASSDPSSLTTLSSSHGSRDLQDVVEEIKHEFEIASTYGKDVALLLEVGKSPYQHKGAIFKVIFSRIVYSVAPSKVSSHLPSGHFVRVTSKDMKMAKAYVENAGSDSSMKSGNISETLQQLYAWEKKLYKEVKDEERLRVIYEKQCKRLKRLDETGAEFSKIEAAQASIRKLLTKIDVCIKAVDTISRRIHKLRDEELEPQLTELINGLIKMWKSMLKCHQKQFQVIMESKTRSLRANTGLRKDSSLRATLELEMELLNWYTRFNNWIGIQKSYVGSLNDWLLRCLHNEPEETADGIAPFSPSRMGAPPIFVVCNDWYQAMVRLSEKGVTDAMHDFASNLHQLWERQDEEQRQRIKAEYLSKDFEKRLKTLRMERGRRMEQEQDALSEKAASSKIATESGISPLDDLKVDLDSMRKRLEEERGRHKEAMKLVHDAASSSLQAGLIPIFEALRNFTSEVVTAHEQVRLQHAVSS